MKIHSALEAGGRVVKKETVTSWDRFQAQSIWGIPVNTSNDVAQSLTIQSDGKILVAGTSNSDFAVQRDSWGLVT